MSLRPLPFRGAHPEAERVAAWLEGRLNLPARDELQHHLAHCAACRELACLAAQARGDAVAMAPRRLTLAAWSAAAALCLATGAGAMYWWQPLPEPPAHLAAISVPVMPAPRSAAVPTNVPTNVAEVNPHPVFVSLPAAPVPTMPEPAPAVTQVAAFVPVSTGFIDQPVRPVVAEPAVFREGGLSGSRSAIATVATRMASPFVSANAAAPAPTVGDLEREVGSRYAGSSALRSRGASSFVASSGDVGNAGVEPSWMAPAGMMGAALPQAASQVEAGVGWVTTRGDNLFHKVSAELLSDGEPAPAVQASTIAGDGDRLWAAGLSNQVWTSPDGSHWQKVDLPGGDSDPSAIVSISFRDSRHGAMTAQDGRGWHTTDGGQHWKLSPSQIQ